VKHVNDYSIIIQEYFQARVVGFLEKYAKEVFGIHHYFATFEFSNSRGQIHVHLLAMLGKKSRITNIPQINNKTNSKWMNDATQCQGGLQFLNLSEEVMELDQVVRQAEDQAFFKSILERLRLGWMIEQDDSHLRLLTLADDN
jgi:hypothetical protein